MNIHHSILSCVGNTPIIRINKLAPEGVNLFVKAESFNPLGSVKDRLALGVIEAAEKSGALKPGMTVIEATSGNTGIGLAMVCAVKGYPLVVTMAENFSIERRKLLRYLGAKVVLTPAEKKGSGMLAKAVELSEKHGWFLCRQFENEANAEVHSKTTAQEILADFADTSLDYWVTGYGTGGTLKGVASVLKQASPDTQIIVCEPDNSPILGSGIIPEPQSSGVVESHPAFRPHVMQGWSPDFIPKLTHDAVAEHLIDKIIPVNGEASLNNAKALAQKEGLFVGISGGATFTGALEVCRTAKPGSNILCMLPDTGERYLSTQLFDGIQADMDEAELEISRSTEGYRFDVKSASPAPAAPTQVEPQAQQLLEELISNPDNKVVLFALEWCEFCWSVRKLFKKMEIDYLSVDLDSVAYQADDKGGKLRAALNQKTDCVTIPQIFIDGEFIGGCTDFFDGVISGDIQNKLNKAGVKFNQSIKVEPYSMLPKWLQPR